MICGVACAQPPATVTTTPATANGNTSQQTAEPSADSIAAAKGITLRIQQVTLITMQPMVTESLKQLWDDLQRGENDEKSLSRTRIMPRAAFTEWIQPLEINGLAKRADFPLLVLNDDLTRDVIASESPDSTVWKFSATKSADQEINLVFDGRLALASRDGTVANHWTLKSQVSLKQNETLIIEGPLTQTLVTEISRVPYVKEFPAKLRAEKRSTIETQQQLYVVTIESLPESK